MTKHQFIERIKHLERGGAANERQARWRLLAWLVLGYVGVLLACGVPVLMLLTLTFVLPYFELWVWALLSLGLSVVYTYRICNWLRDALHPQNEGYRQLHAGDAPALFELIESVRSRANGPFPQAVFISEKMDVTLTRYPGWMFIGRSSYQLVLGLPMLQTLTRTQLATVIAHEYGHLVAAKTPLYAHVYAMRRTWRQLAGAFRGRSFWSILGGARIFLNWYVPRFDAETFASARDGEYRADAFSADLMGRESVVQTLYAVKVAARYLNRVFWPAVYAGALHSESCSGQPYVQLAGSAAIRKVDSIQATVWLHAELCMRSDYDDTHPCLAERAQRLGADLENCGAPALSQADAGAQLLGDVYMSCVQQQDTRWRKEAELAWASYRKHWLQTEAEYHVWVRRSATRALGAKDYLKIAMLGKSLRIVGWEAYLARSLVLQPNYTDALYEEGLRRLESGASQDLDVAQRMFTQAMHLDPKEIYRCARALTHLCLLRGDQAQAQRFRREADQEFLRRYELSVELNNVQARDVFAGPGLAQQELRALCDELRALIQRASGVWLARKVPLTDESRAYYVLLVRAGDPVWLRLINVLFARPDGTRQQCERLVRKLSPALPLTYVWHFVSPGDPMLRRATRDFVRLR